jgi:glucose-1-phosphate cytidylyltransferase
MKVVLLAGGLGTRLAEETGIRPKPMVEIGGRPIIWHIMKMYSEHGLKDFVVCCGYKGWMIKEYFASYFLRHSDVTVDTGTNTIDYHSTSTEQWRITLIDTGEDTLTGGRLRRVAGHLDETFCLTYGDGVSDVNITKLVEFHRANGKLATVTAVQPAGRYGALNLATDSAEVTGFAEKPVGDGNWINGGFFVLEPGVVDLIEGDSTVWEQGPMQTLAHTGQLNAYRHNGYWQSMDSLADKQKLEVIWGAGNAPWKNWK